MKNLSLIGAAAVSAFVFSSILNSPAYADVILFSTGAATNQMATASRPDSAGQFEIESADDFPITSPTSVNSATFTGLITSAPGVIPTIGEVRVEIYRIFPTDSDVGRTSGSPTFSTPNVPTRVNSPSDVEFADRDTASGNLTFTTTTLASTFTANNSVTPGGIHPKPGQTTGGNQAQTGTEVQFNITFTVPFVLPTDHYFFVPQVQVTDGVFLWLSGQRPVPFPPGLNDLQEWTRDGGIEPDWLRVGTDIVGGTTPPTFNGAFSLSGVVPEPSSLALFGTALIGFGLLRRRKQKRDH